MEEPKAKKARKAAKQKKKQEDEDDDEEEEEEEEEKPKVAASKGVVAEKNDQGEAFFELSKMRRLTVREFKGQVLIDIREVCACVASFVYLRDISSMQGIMESWMNAFVLYKHRASPVFLYYLILIVPMHLISTL